MVAGAVMVVMATFTPVMAQTNSADLSENASPKVSLLDPLAIEILGAATSFLAGQSAMSVNWLVSFDVVVDGREKITYLRSGQNLLERDVGFYSRAEFDESTREYYFDGASIQIFDVEENTYVLAPFEGDFDALATRLNLEYGIRLPIWQIMSVSPGSALLDRAESAAYLGVVKFAGREAHHLALADYDNDWQVWISTDAERPELMMLVGTDPYTQGWPQYRVYFSNWDFDPEIPEGAFSFSPDADVDRMAWPKRGDGVLQGRAN